MKNKVDVSGYEKSDDLINDSEILSEANNRDNTSEYGSGPTPGSGFNGPARVAACKNKKYGDYCTWQSNSGSQTGRCIWDKWGLTNGELFCAKKDYREDDDSLNSED